MIVSISESDRPRQGARRVAALVGALMSVSIAPSMAQSGWHTLMAIGAHDVAGGNVDAATAQGTAPLSGGFDGSGHSLDAADIPAILPWSGQNFSLQTNGLDAWSATSVPLSGQGAVLYLIGAGVNGGAVDQTFILNYADGSAIPFSLSLSDWRNGPGYEGEHQVLAPMPTRIGSDGAVDHAPVHLFGYRIPIDPAKTVSSLTLPNNRNVVILGAQPGDSHPDTPPIPAGTYTLVNQASGYAMTSGEGQFWVNVAPYTIDIQQGWTLTPLGNGLYTITNLYGGKTLDAQYGSIDPGTSVIQWTANGQVNQQWWMQPSNGGFILLGNGSGLPVDPGANDGTTQLTLESATGDANQIWTVASPFQIITLANIQGETIPNRWWYKTPATVTLNASATAGIAATYYTINGSPTQTYTGPFTLNASNVYSMMFWSVDNDGNVEQTHWQIVEVDTVAPVTTESVTGTTVTLNTTDDESGVLASYYTIDGGSAQYYNGAFTLTAAGTHTINHWSEDNAGNVEAAHSLTVTVPLTLSTVTLSPQNVTGGVTSTLTVNLNGPAPSTGTTVTLKSDNAAATVIASVKVPAGATSAQATITTVPVATSTLVTITAKAGVSHTAHLRIVPPAVTGLKLTPSAVPGGTGSTGTVTLTGVTAVNTAVTVTSSDPSAMIVGPVVVPAGASSTTFSLSTLAVTASTASTITAAAGGASKTVTLTIKPPYLASASFSPRTAKAGSNVKLTITLASPAPSTGAVVAITYTSNGSLLLGAPTSLSVPAGGLTASATFGTKTVSVNTDVIVSATVNGSTKGGTLTITP